MFKNKSRGKTFLPGSLARLVPILGHWDCETIPLLSETYAYFYLYVAAMPSTTNAGHPPRRERSFGYRDSTLLRGIKWLHCLRSNECFGEELQVSHTAIICSSIGGHSANRVSHAELPAQFAGRDIRTWLVVWATKHAPRLILHTRVWRADKKTHWKSA